ncbi:MFS general substrate transporter [Paxillus ammoniavirescens]|nr:MFS general substrate transporter [Paxillus ammoniavirescens]
MTGDYFTASLATGSCQSIGSTSESTVTLIENVLPLDRGKPSMLYKPQHEGDLSSLSTALGAFLMLLCSYGYLLSFGVYQDYYTQHYLPEQSSSAISWIGGTNLFLFEITGLLSGRLHDLGYFHYLVIGGSLLQGFSIFMLSFAKPGQFYQIFLSQGIGSGIAVGLVFIPTMAVLSHHFDKHLATVMTLVMSGASLGAAVHPIILNNTINGQLGFANGVRMSAVLLSVLMFVACLIMRTNMPPRDDHAKFFISAKKCVQDSAYMFCITGLTMFDISCYYPLFYLQLDSITHGLDKTFSFYSLVIMNFSSIIAQLLTGLLTNVFGVDVLIIASNSGAAVLLFGMTGITTAASVVAFAVLYGCCYGLVLALIGPMLALLTPDPSELGVRLGIPGILFAFSGLIGPPISGALLTDRNIWYRGAVFNGTLGTVGTVLLVAMKVILDRRACRP